MPVAAISSRFFLCTSLYTAKKSYFALSSLSEFLRASAGCSNKQPVFVYAKIVSLLILTLSTLLSAIFVVIEFCARVLICTRRLKIPSYLHTLSKFLRVSAGCLKAAGFSYVLVCTLRKNLISH